MLGLDDLDSPGSPCLTILEFQSGPDEDKLHTTLVSVAHMRVEVRHGPSLQGRYRVVAGLVYLRGQAPQITLDMTLPPSCIAGIGGLVGGLMAGGGGAALMAPPGAPTRTPH